MNPLEFCPVCAVSKKKIRHFKLDYYSIQCGDHFTAVYLPMHNKTIVTVYGRQWSIQDYTFSFRKEQLTEIKREIMKYAHIRDCLNDSKPFDGHVAYDPKTYECFFFDDYIKVAQYISTSKGKLESKQVTFYPRVGPSFNDSYYSFDGTEIKYGGRTKLARDFNLHNVREFFDVQILEREEYQVISQRVLKTLLDEGKVDGFILDYKDKITKQRNRIFKCSYHEINLYISWERNLVSEHNVIPVTLISNGIEKSKDGKYYAFNGTRLRTIPRTSNCAKLNEYLPEQLHWHSVKIEDRNHDQLHLHPTKVDDKVNPEVKKATALLPSMPVFDFTCWLLIDVRGALVLNDDTPYTIYYKGKGNCKANEYIRPYHKVAHVGVQYAEGLSFDGFSYKCDDKHSKMYPSHYSTLTSETRPVILTLLKSSPSNGWTFHKEGVGITPCLDGDGLILSKPDATEIFDGDLIRVNIKQGLGVSFDGNTYYECDNKGELIIYKAYGQRITPRLGIPVIIMRGHTE